MDIYNINIECNYRDFDDEKEADLVYKKNLIEVLNLQDDIMNNELFDMMGLKVEKLSEYLKEKELYEKIEPLVKKASSIFIIEKEDVGMMMLFSYDFFDMFHILICQLLNDGEVKDDDYELLKGKLP